MSTDMPTMTIENIREAISNVGVNGLKVLDGDMFTWRILPTGDWDENEWTVEHERVDEGPGVPIPDAHGLTDTELANKIGRRTIRLWTAGEPNDYKLASDQTKIILETSRAKARKRLIAHMQETSQLSRVQAYYLVYALSRNFRCYLAARHRDDDVATVAEANWQQTYSIVAFFPEQPSDPDYTSTERLELIEEFQRRLQNEFADNMLEQQKQKGAQT